MWLIAYALTGAVVGFLAGLLGIGGGMTLVPVFSAMFQAQSLSVDHTVHLALATAMASVVFTSSSSVLAHHRLGSVDWSIVRRMAPGMVAGSLLSTLAAGWLSQRVLALGFALIVYGGATQMLLGRKPAPGRTLPGPLPMTALGLGIGVICGLVSAGGAFLTVPVTAEQGSACWGPVSLWQAAAEWPRAEWRSVTPGSARPTATKSVGARAPQLDLATAWLPQ